MTQTADVVIVGAGVVGASIAFHLARAGVRDVVLLEREAAQGLGSTGKATGGVRAQFGTAINVRLSRWSLEFFERFTDETGHDCGYEPVGYLFLASTHEQLAQLARDRAVQRPAGIADTKSLDVDDVRRMAPHLNVDDVIGGSFRQRDGYIVPLEVMRGFTNAAVDMGARVEFGTTVSGIDVEHGAVTGVQTRNGTIATRCVVNAAGAAAADVARLAGIELPVVPRRRQLAATHAVSAIPHDMPLIIDLASGYHLRRITTSDGHTAALMGCTGGDESPTRGAQCDAEFLDRVMRHAKRRVPALAHATIDHARSRAGLYEMSPDHHAILGEPRDLRGFWLANGFSGHGVMHSPATGCILADLITRGKTDVIDASQLDLERFAEGRAIHDGPVL